MVLRRFEREEAPMLRCLQPARGTMTRLRAVFEGKRPKAKVNHLLVKLE